MIDINRIAENGANDTLAIVAPVAELTDAFRRCKRADLELHGKFDILPTDKAEGLNIRKANLADSAAVERVFRPFVHPARKPLDRVFVDEKRNAVVATDGITMLMCDIPEGLKPDEHFVTEGYCSWTMPLNGLERENTPYALCSLDKVVEFEKCGHLHNILAATAACSKSYRHDDKDGYWKNLYMWIGNKQYDPAAVYKVVYALFRLGSSGVAVYRTDYGMLHIVGVGDGINARGLVMPMRFPTTEAGSAVFPIKGIAVKAA